MLTLLFKTIIHFSLKISCHAFVKFLRKLHMSVHSWVIAGLNPRGEKGQCRIKRASHRYFLIGSLFPSMMCCTRDKRVSRVKQNTWFLNKFCGLKSQVQQQMRANNRISPSSPVPSANFSQALSSFPFTTLFP